MKKFLIIAFGICLTLTGATYAAQSAHSRMTELKESFPVMKNIPVTVTNPFSASLLVNGEYRMATHHRKSHRIFVADILFWTDMKGSIIHEGGHYAFDLFVPPAQQWQYCKLFQLNGHSPSRYGKTSCRENFAEMFAYVNGSRHQMFSNLEEHLEGSMQKKFVERISKDIINKSK